MMPYHTNNMHYYMIILVVIYTIYGHFLVKCVGKQAKFSSYVVAIATMLS